MLEQHQGTDNERVFSWDDSEFEVHDRAFGDPGYEQRVQLDSNGVIGADASGLDFEYYPQTQGED